MAEPEEKLVRELFVEELATVQGGTRPLLPCPWVTTHACGEEQFPCSLCQ
jgi:hypothetical protein